MVIARSAAPLSTPAQDAEAPPAPVSLATVQSLLAGLNREQRRAVTHRDGPQLVIAGPGTGKTEVVTRRVAWLIATKRALPREILALTFTDAAAQEMQARVDTLVPYGQADAAIHTFHALGDRLVREHAFELGLPGDVRLVTGGEQVVLLREHLFELGLERYLPLGDPTRFLSALVDLFMRAKDEGVSPRAFREHADALLAAAASDPARDGAALTDLAGARLELAGAFEAYQRLLARRGLIDHGDQIALALRLLRERPALRAEVSGRYRYVLVDEFQDTNPTQLDLVLALTGEQANVTLVGDPDQAIYAFRGAATSNLRRFVAIHPDVRWVVLRRNYRSRTPILRAASRLIGHNRSSTEMATTTLGWPVAQRRGRAAAPVRRLCYETPEAEANGVAALIAQRIEAGARPGEFAVLVRTNSDVDSFARSLAARGVPVAGAGPQPLIAQPYVRAMLAYLRVLADPSASMELYLLAAGPPYALPGEQIGELLAGSRRRHVPLWQVLQAAADASDTPRIGRVSRDVIRRLVADVRAGLALAPLRTTGEVLYDFLRRSGTLDRLAAIEPHGDSLELRAVVRFFELCRSRARLLPEDRVASLVPHLTAMSETAPEDEHAAGEPPNAVSVLTVHRAKGLEFRYVYLCALVEGRFPSRSRPPLLTLPPELLAHRSGMPDEDPVAEERRLAYVAMTRARDELWLSHHLTGPDRRGARRPSPFIAEALDAPAVPVEQPRDLLAALQPPAEATPAAPRGVAHEGPLALSYSQIDDYVTCPERYRLRYVIGVPTPAHHALAYGSAMHSAVAAFHLRRGKGQAMSEDELLAAFDAAWVPEGFLSREHEEARYAAGRQALVRFHRRMLREPAATVAVEKPFSFSVGRDVVRGRMDRLDADPDGTVIVDYKSSDVPEQAKADKRARESLQLQIYALAHQAETGDLPRELRLHFLDSDTVGSTVPDAGQLAKARQKIASAADGIRAAAFDARPNPVACAYCPFREICQRSAVRAAA